MTTEAIKRQAQKSVNLIWIALGFSLIYWILEAVRDVVTFGKGDLFQRIFMPDFMSFWTRFLALCILLLFGIYAQTLLQRLKTQADKPVDPKRIIFSGVLFSLLYWTIESVRDTVLMENVRFIDRLLFPDTMHLWMRMLAVFIIVLLSLYVHTLTREQVRIDKALEKERNRLYTAVERGIADYAKSNNYLRIENEALRSEQKGAEQAGRIFRAVLAGCEVMLREHKVSDLLNKICDAFVRSAGFPMAAVGFRKGEEDLDVVWMGHAVADARYPALLDVAREEYELERWPVGQTLKTGIPSVVENLEEEPENTHWANAAVRAGLTRLICLPLNESGHATGVLNLFPSRDMKIGEDALESLKGFAEMLAYTLSEIRKAKTHKKIR